MRFGRQRKQKPELQRQPSDESYSSTISPSETNYRQALSFNVNGDGWSSMGSGSRSSSGGVSLKSSTTMATDCLSASWSSSGSYALSHVHLDTNYCSVESKIRSTAFSEEADKSMCVLDLISQLSFSPSRKTKKRTNTADTDVSSSFDSLAPHYEDNTSHNGIEELRTGTPSPLLGLQYLPEYFPDGNMYLH